MQLKLITKWVQGGRYALFLTERKRLKLLQKDKVLFPGFLLTIVI